MSGWREVTLGDLCERVTVGHVGRMADRYVDDGVPFLRSQNVKPFVIDRSGMLRVDDAFHQQLAKSTLAKGDVVVVRTGYPGTAAVIPPELDGSNCADLVVITPGKELNPHVLAAVFNSSWGRSTVSGNLVGAAQQHFNIGSAKTMRLRLPCKREQDQIAEVLCTFHDLIDNSRRRVEALEEMARAIYREWFVHFRYPGHENVPLVDSRLGPIPEAWRMSTCGDELIALGGGTPSKKEAKYWDGGDIPWFTPSDLTRTSFRYAGGSELMITAEGLSRSSARLFPAGSVMMTSRATLGVLAIATVNSTTNQGFIVIPPDDRWSSGFIREWLDSHADELASVATGATFKEITKGAFKRVPFLVPDQRVLDAHRILTAPIECQIKNLEEQIRTVTELRDLLLPKLVSGQIELSHLDEDPLVQVATA